VRNVVVRKLLVATPAPKELTMGQDSKIAWTRHTFNPWIGCTKVSDGCKNCYAEALMDKRWGKVKWGPNGTRSRTSPANWRQPIAWNAAAEAAGERHRVFCASLADVFEGRPELDEWLVDLLLLIDETPHLDWLLLTKRPENVAKFMPTSFQKYPRGNVWIGTSVEDQSTADVRIPHLLAMRWPVVRFVSYEPALGPVKFGGWLRGHDGFCEDAGCSGGHARIDWVIVGGESGAGARDCRESWMAAVVGDCRAAGVPAFVKQMGSTFVRDRDWVGVAHQAKLRDRKGGDISEFPVDLRVREFPHPAAYSASQGVG
jgi:protein gp37